MSKKKSRKKEQEVIADKAAAEAQALKDMTRLFELEEDARQLEQAMNDQHEVYKDAKTSFEAAQTRIREFIRDCRDAEKNYPLLHQKAESKAGDDTPDGWRDTPIDQVVQDKKVLGHLQAEGITTLGAYCDWRAAVAGDQGYQEPLLKFKGVGQAKADKVADQVIAWWAKAQVEHPTWGQESPPKTAEDVKPAEEGPKDEAKPNDGQ